MQEGSYSSIEPRSAFSRWGPRVLAPLALVACAIAVLSVVNAGESDTADSGRSEQAQARQGGGQNGGGGGGGDSDAPASYTVETGDTLGSIAAETGVSLDKLEQLNPDIDPTALQAGQELKLK